MSTKYEVNKPFSFEVLYDHVIFFDCASENIIEE